MKSISILFHSRSTTSQIQHFKTIHISSKVMIKMSLGFNGLFNVALNPNLTTTLNVHDFDQFDFNVNVSSDVQHNDECRLVVINPNSCLNNINSNSTIITSNDINGSTICCSSKSFYHNVQVVFRSIGITLILLIFTIIFLQQNCVSLTHHSRYNFIYLYNFTGLICMVLIGLILIFFIKKDKSINNMFKYCQNNYGNIHHESIVQQLDDGMDNCIVNSFTFWYDCTLLVMIGRVFIHSIIGYLIRIFGDAMIIVGCKWIRFSITYLFVYYVMINMIFNIAIYQLYYDCNIIEVLIDAFEVQFGSLFIILIGILSLFYVICNEKDSTIASVESGQLEFACTAYASPNIDFMAENLKNHTIRTVRYQSYQTICNMQS